MPPGIRRPYSTSHPLVLFFAALVIAAVLAVMANVSGNVALNLSLFAAVGVLFWVWIAYTFLYYHRRRI